MKRRLSTVLSFEALTGVLHLREDLRVVSIKVHLDSESVEFIVEGPQLDEVPRRAQIRRVPLAELMGYEFT